MNPCTVGCDPELFLVDEEGNFRSAHNIVPGSKYSPTAVRRGAVQPDGLAAEFNIEPASTAVEFEENITIVMQELAAIVDSKKKGLRLFVAPTARFEQKYFNRLPKAAKKLGCSPDYSFHYNKANTPPDAKQPVRWAGGHIHVGWTKGKSLKDKDHLIDCKLVVRQLDEILYPLSTLWDSDRDRRDAYGKPGAYRPKSYGVEYRSLSNAWIADPDLHRWIFETVRFSVGLVDNEMMTMNDIWTQVVATECLDGKEHDRQEILDFYEYLVDDFHLPRLPTGYVSR